MHQPDKNWIPIFFAWVVSLVGMLASLFFSEVMDLPPCLLCWYQRLCLYPLVIVFGVGLLREDRAVDLYAWPFVGLGFLLALYHNLLYYGVVPERLAPCTKGVSCSTRLLEGVGFISIPLLSLFGFLAVAGCLLVFSLKRKGLR